MTTTEDRTDTTAPADDLTVARELLATRDPAIQPNRALLRALVGRVEQAEAAVASRRDELLADVISRAKQYADEHGWCESFDQIMSDLGLPGRDRVWTVPVRGTWQTTVEVEATTAADARQVVNIWTRRDMTRALKERELGDLLATIEPAGDAWVE